MDELISILFHEETLVFVLNPYIITTSINFYIHLLILNPMEKLIPRRGQLRISNLDLENKTVEDPLITNIIKHPYNSSQQDMYDQF